MVNQLLETSHPLSYPECCEGLPALCLRASARHAISYSPYFLTSSSPQLDGKVMNAIAHRELEYCGELSLSSMTKNYLEVAVEIAQEAGKILVEELSRPLELAYKGDEVDLVTQADKRSERFIVERLTKYFPDHAIAAEEGTGHESASASEFRWHVDPLDGTTNFAHGYPCFSVSIALAQRDTLLAAAVFNPFYNELFSAARGEGATFNGKKIHVSKNATLSTSLLCTGFPVRNRKLSPNLQYYGDFTQNSHGVRRDGSAALDLASVASGRFDGFWEFGLAKWDVAAGILLIEEAGGKVSDFAGNPYQLGGPIILATNGLIHDEMCAMAREIARRSAAPLRP
jgi:myo-inositol-1(or 4)-monophosphatase